MNNLIKFMQNPTKIQLSRTETEMVNNAEWILTKNQIIKKVGVMLAGINDLMKNKLTDYYAILPGDIKYQNGKISRGENYKSLPYMILDYPAFFEKDNVFAIRTMFWWGNFFSITLHLSGNQKEKFMGNNISTIFLFLKKNNFSVCVNQEEWQHDFEDENYLPDKELTEEKFKEVIQKSFFKMAKKIPLTQWDYIDTFVIESFSKILEILKINYLSGKKDLLPESPITGSGL